MATQALSAFGTYLQVSNSGWQTIAEIRTISGFGGERDMIDVTNMSSPGGWKEFIGAFIDGLEVQIECNYLPGDATHQAMLANLVQQNLTLANKTYQILFPDSEAIGFIGKFKGAKPSGSTTTALSITATLKITGPVTFPS